MSKWYPTGAFRNHRIATRVASRWFAAIPLIAVGLAPRAFMGSYILVPLSLLGIPFIPFLIGGIEVLSSDPAWRARQQERAAKPPGVTPPEGSQFAGRRGSCLSRTR